jgi:hypothetical protein
MWDTTREPSDAPSSDPCNSSTFVGTNLVFTNYEHFTTDPGIRAICGPSTTRITGSNPAKGVDVCLLCLLCVVSR